MGLPPCGDFESVELEPGDFVYADPPYDVEFRQYAKDGFDWPEQERLARWLRRHPWSRDPEQPGDAP